MLLAFTIESHFYRFIIHVGTVLSVNFKDDVVASILDVFSVTRLFRFKYVFYEKVSK